MYMYTSASTDSPKLNNTYGDFNKVINYILDGGSEQSVVSIEAIEPNKCKIYFSGSVPFVQFQTFQVSGAITTAYNTRYFVESINAVDKYAICYCHSISVITAIDSSVNIKAVIFGCGLTKVFGGVSDNRTVFKTPNGTHYRVDDRDFRPLVTPVAAINSTTNNWHRVARVCISDGFDSLDSTSNRMFPYNPERPTENFNPTGNYIGQTLVSYNRGVNPNNSIYNSYLTYNETRHAMDWIAYANDKVIYITLYTQLNTNYNVKSSATYVFGEFNGINNSLKNSLLVCNKSSSYNSTYDSGDYILSMASYNTSENFNPIFPSNYTNGNTRACAITFDNMANSIDDIKFSGGSGISPTYSGGSGSISYPNPVDNSLYFSDVMVRSSSKLYGACIGMKYIDNYIGNSGVVLSESIKQGTLMNISGSYYLLHKSPNAANDPNQYNNTVFVLYELDRY